MHNVEEVRRVLAALEVAVPLVTLVSPGHSDAFTLALTEVRTLTQVCVLRRPESVDFCQVWKTLRGLPDWQNAGWTTYLMNKAARNLEVSLPSWTPPQEAFDMLGELACAASELVLAISRPTKGGRFSAPSAEQEKKHLAGAKEEIDKALAHAKALGLLA